MDIFRTTAPNHYVPIHPDNVNKRDWLILLEVGTIVGPDAYNIRVAKATLEKTIAKKYNIFLGKKYFVVLEGFDPQIHVLYFCPQLYKRDMEGNLVALEGEEIGDLLVQAFRNGAVKGEVWYRPSDILETPPILGKSTNIDLDTLIGKETIPKQGRYVPIET
jgi:hypothetical protein